MGGKKWNTTGQLRSPSPCFPSQGKYLRQRGIGFPKPLSHGCAAPAPLRGEPRVARERPLRSPAHPPTPLRGRGWWSVLRGRGWWSVLRGRDIAHDKLHGCPVVPHRGKLPKKYYALRKPQGVCVFQSSKPSRSSAEMRNVLQIATRHSTVGMLLSFSQSEIVSCDTASIAPNCACVMPASVRISRIRCPNVVFTLLFYENFS